MGITAAIEAAGVVTIIAAVVVVLALVYFLLMTILALRKITNGLDVVVEAVGEIVTKTAPVNGVVDALGITLGQGRDVLEGLLVKKAGGDASGLIESCFPGEGANFNTRTRQHGPVRNIGEVYPRGEEILGSVLAAAASLNPGGAAAAPAPEPERMTVGARRPWEDEPAPAAPEPAAAEPEPAAAPAPAEASDPGRIAVGSERPWETGGGAAPAAPAAAPAAQPAPATKVSAPAPAPAEQASDPGRIAVRRSRPWES